MWRKLTPTLEVLEDRYAYRYIEAATYVCYAFVYHLESYQMSDTVVFCYDDYITPADAINAAKAWTLRRDSLEREAEVLPFTPKTSYKYYRANK